MNALTTSAGSLSQHLISSCSLPANGNTDRRTPSCVKSRNTEREHRRHRLLNSVLSALASWAA